MTRVCGPLLSDESGAARRALDAYDFVHGIVEGVFGLVFPDPQARLALRLKAISRAGDGEMTWYLWTMAHAGAFALSLAADRADDPDGGALLTLRYFPEPSEASFASFSTHEQQVRLSALFDATGTPAFAKAGELAPELFTIGTLMLRPQGLNEFALLVDLPERWIEQITVAGQAMRLRDVASARIAMPVVDALVSGLVYLGRSAPTSVRVWQRPGRALHIAPDGDVELLAHPSTVEWALEFSGLPIPGRQRDGACAARGPSSTDPAWFDHTQASAPAAPPWPVNPLWWQAAGWTFDPVGIFCGHCAAESAGGRIRIQTHHCEGLTHEPNT
jgi:hypothetical protein